MARKSRLQQYVWDFSRRYTGEKTVAEMARMMVEEAKATTHPAHDYFYIKWSTETAAYEHRCKLARDLIRHARVEIIRFPSKTVTARVKVMQDAAGPSYQMPGRQSKSARKLLIAEAVRRLRLVLGEFPLLAQKELRGIHRICNRLVPPTSQAKKKAA